MPIHVDLCCNDPDNGNDTGYAESIELFDCTLVGGRVRVAFDPEPPSGVNPYEGVSTLRFGRMRLPILGYKGWYGNWCWDRATMRLIHAVAIWNYLVNKSDWHCEEGPEELYELFNAHREIEPRTAPDFLHRILHPDLHAPANPSA